MFHLDEAIINIINIIIIILNNKHLYIYVMIHGWNKQFYQNNITFQLFVSPFLWERKKKKIV